jgi:hypothetical protein
MWMDGALMGAPFSSLPVPGLTKVANSSCIIFFPFLSPGWFSFGEHFFPHPPRLPRSHLPAYIQTTCLCTLVSSLPHLPTYLPTYSPIYLPTHPSTYLCTYALNHHQGNQGIAIYQVDCFTLLPTYPPNSLPTSL